MLFRKITIPKELPTVRIELTSNFDFGRLHAKHVAGAQTANSHAKGTSKSAIRVLRSLFKIANVPTITIYASDPRTIPNFTSIVRYCRQKNKTVFVTSDRVSGSRKQYDELVDMGGVYFSLPFHSAVTQEHEYLTDFVGGHRSSLESLIALQKAGANPSPNILLTQINYRTIDSTILYLRKLGFRKVILNRYIDKGRRNWDSQGLMLSASELRHTYNKINHLAQKEHLWISSNACTTHCILSPMDYPRIRFEKCDKNLNARAVTIDVKGNIRFCDQSPFMMGNVFEHKLDKILDSVSQIKWKRDLTGICKNCTVQKTCTAGCRSASIWATDDERIIPNKIHSPISPLEGNSEISLFKCQ